MGPRNFIRGFKATAGRPPVALSSSCGWRRRRVCSRKAPHDPAGLLEGYEDIAFVRTLSKRHTGMTPADDRSRLASTTVQRGELVSGRVAEA